MPLIELITRQRKRRKKVTHCNYSESRYNRLLLCVSFNWISIPSALLCGNKKKVYQRHRQYANYLIAVVLNTSLDSCASDQLNCCCSNRIAHWHLFWLCFVPSKGYGGGYPGQGAPQGYPGQAPQGGYPGQAPPHGGYPGQAPPQGGYPGYTPPGGHGGYAPPPTSGKIEAINKHLLHFSKSKMKIQWILPHQFVHSNRILAKKNVTHNL